MNPPDRLDLVAQHIGRLSRADAERFADMLAERGVPRETALGVVMVAAAWGWERTRLPRQAAPAP